MDKFDLKENLSISEYEKYQESIVEFEKFLDHKNIKSNFALDDIDEFCIETFVIFHSPKYGFPNEIYKGRNEDERDNFSIELYRTIKTKIKEFCILQKDNKSLIAIKNVSVSALTVKITESTGIDSVLIMICLFAILEFSRAYSLNYFCDFLA